MTHTKTLLLSLLLICLVGVNAFAQDDAAKKVKDGERLPSIELTNLDGDDIDIAAYYGENGKITVFSFWSTFCGPCIKELKAVADLYPDWQDDYDMEFVAVSVDDSRTSDRVRTMVNGRNWEYDVLLDVNADFIMSVYGNKEQIPVTIIVDQDGNVISKKNGYKSGDEEILEEKIKELAAANK